VRRWRIPSGPCETNAIRLPSGDRSIAGAAPESVALHEHEGHIFTVILQGLEGFDRATKKRDEPSLSPERTVIAVDAGPGGADTAMKLVGRWYNADALKASDPTLQIGPIAVTKDADGHLSVGTLLANPSADTRHVLLVTCEEVAQLGTQAEQLLFYGGFDSRAVMNDRSREAGCLMFMYPVPDSDELKKKLGTVDYFKAMGTI